MKSAFKIFAGEWIKEERLIVGASMKGAGISVWMLGPTIWEEVGRFQWN